MKNFWRIGLVAVLLSSCGKTALPPVTLLIPQIISTEVLPSTEGVTLYATVGGSINLTACGFGLVKDGLIREYPASFDKGKMNFSAAAAGLEADTEYAFYAFIANGTSRIQTPERNFRTLPRTPSVAPPSPGFTDVSAIPGPFSAVLSATVEDASHVEYCGFGLSRAGRKTVEYGATLEGNRFTAEVTNLLPSTEYVCYAFVSEDGRRINSEYFRFTTADDPSLHFSDLSADATDSQVTLQARLSRIDGLVKAGFALAPDGESFMEKDAQPDAEGLLTLKWEGLKAGTHYRFYAYAVTADGRKESEVLDFNTESPSYSPVSFLSVEAGVNGSSANLKAVLSGVEGISDYGFGLSTNRYDFVEYSASLTADGFEKLVTNLQDGTTYYFYAFFTLGGSFCQSDTVSFKISHE